MDLLENLGIQITHTEATHTVVTMAISPKTKQPFGLLHGGVNSVLAETAASVAANAYLATQGAIAVGVSIQTNHLKALKTGVLVAEATPLHLGRQTLVYQVETHLANETAISSFSTVTLMARPKVTVS